MIRLFEKYKYLINIPTAIRGLHSEGRLSNQCFSWEAKNALATEGLSRDPIATPSICVDNILSNKKYEFFLANGRRSLNLLFFKSWTIK